MARGRRCLGFPLVVRQGRRDAEKKSISTNRRGARALIGGNGKWVQLQR